MPRVKFLRENTELDVPERANLRREALRAKIELYPGFSKYVNCRGNSLCGKCAVLIKDGKQNCSPKGFREKLRLMLSYLPIGREDELRLACQTRVLGPSCHPVSAVILFIPSLLLSCRFCYPVILSSLYRG
ncbi:MAG: iron ABC transporter substrate-binding protein [Acidobacteria bacterium]|nr:MAG: iron ABC transporter substrate-binding protein [Acidobacteriota bacterium]